MSVFDDNDIQAKSAETIIMDWLDENVEITEKYWLDCIDYMKCSYKVRTIGDVKIINKDIKDFCGGMIIFETTGQFSCSGCKYLENIDGISLISQYVNLTGCESITGLPDFAKGTIIICDDCTKLKLNEQQIKDKKWIIIGSGFQLIHNKKTYTPQAHYWSIDSDSLGSNYNVLSTGQDSYIELYDDYNFKKIF